MKKYSILFTCCFPFILSIYSCDPPRSGLFNCTALGYLRTLQFVIRDKHTSENLITKGVYKQEDVRLFYESAPGKYDTLYHMGGLPNMPRDTVAVDLDIDHPVFSQSRDFYIKYDASDIDTLKIMARADRSNVCKTEYTLKQFWINGKAVTTPRSFNEVFVINK
ncbi:hypothetical protein [Niabella drilacis]|uniref:Lipoprotein n=1 Tax=Niabella drilacis (strain DSM 25811 / CCM 8410 / CCUG 62505 / LMG 26954 / E90) TaxID=1285928 RepID=A0A1G6I4B2_NIADE|nr:hypothetical protein [Niabella drilacis]SDC00566.1 hypothetical protein SAMN04487894_10166 [Niabella drilacis]